MLSKKVRNKEMSDGDKNENVEKKEKKMKDKKCDKDEKDDDDDDDDGHGGLTELVRNSLREILKSPLRS